MTLITHLFTVGISPFQLLQCDPPKQIPSISPTLNIAVEHTWPPKQVAPPQILFWGSPYLPPFRLTHAQPRSQPFPLSASRSGVLPGPREPAEILAMPQRRSSVSPYLTPHFVDSKS